MTSPTTRYDRWKAPAGDGESLIWPAPAVIISEARDNQRRLNSADHIKIQNVPLPEVRRGLRHWLGHQDDEALMIGTGHQTELHHPGVWAKNALIDAAAKATGGQACHIAVDTDEPKHLQLRFPGGSVPLLDDAQTSVSWTELLRQPSPAYIEHVRRYVADSAAGWSFKPAVFDFLDNLRRASLETSEFPRAFTNSVHELDWSLGLRHHALLASPIWSSLPYLVFVHHVLSRIDAFARDYNAALSAYRSENKIRSPGRPMPDLACTADGCEAPFWLDSIAAGSRQRAAAIRLPSGIFAIRAADGSCFQFHANAPGWSAAESLRTWLAQRQLRLSPRALTLTAVLRLLAMDQFAHGIGGGQYDQVLDGLIERHFKLDPPRFCVTTATLYFPGATNEPRVCLQCVADEGRRLKQNVLGDAKLNWVRSIEKSPRRSIQRARLFTEMHDRLTQAWRSGEALEWERRYREAERKSEAERVLFDRELFYAIQPRARLEELIETYSQKFIGL